MCRRVFLPLGEAEEWNTGLYGQCVFTLIRNSPTVLQSDCRAVYPVPSAMRIPAAPHLPALGTARPWGLKPLPRVRSRVPPWRSLALASLRTGDAERLLTPICSLCIFFGEVTAQSFGPFLKSFLFSYY